MKAFLIFLPRHNTQGDQESNHYGLKIIRLGQMDQR
jgi:hypothetical protein